MNEYLSKKIDVVKFFSILMIVFWHANNTSFIHPDAVGYSFFIQEFISRGIVRVAVPLFFLLSGYLFYLNLKRKRQDFLAKYKKRFKTLAIPYLFWSVMGLVLFFCIQKMLPQYQQYFGSLLVTNLSFKELLNKLFINPIPFQFWFIRDLIVLVILSPLIYFLIQRLKIVFISVLAIIWLLDIDLYVIAPNALLFFSTGAYLSIFKSNALLKTHPPKRSFFFALLWLSIVLAKTTLTFAYNDSFTAEPILQKTSIIIGIMAVWSWYDAVFMLHNVENQRFYQFTGFSFFIFALHEPLQTVLKHGLMTLSGGQELLSLLIYFFTACFTIAVCIAVGSLLKQTLPKFYNTITGSR